MSLDKWRIHGTVRLVIVGAVACGIGVVAGTAVAGTGATTSGARVPEGRSGRFSDIAVPCERLPPAPLAVVGRIALGHSASEMAAVGYGVALALAYSRLEVVTGTALAPTPSAASLSLSNQVVVLYPLHGRGVVRPEDVRSTTALAALSNVAQLNAQSSDPTLRSCNYRLSDSPRAQSLMQVATAAMVAQGVVTQEQLDASSTIFLISDDPLRPGYEYVSAVLARSVTVTAPNPTDPYPVGAMASQNLTPIVASINAATKSVSSVGYGNWYAGQ